MKTQKERNLYLVETKRCGTFYAVAETWNEAADAVKDTLDNAGYGFSSEREVESVKLIRQEHWLVGKPFLSGDYDINKIVIVDKKEPVILTEKEKREYVTPSKFLRCIKPVNDNIIVGESYWVEYIGNDTYFSRNDNFLNKEIHLTPEELLTCFIPCGIANSTRKIADHILFLINHGVTNKEILSDIFKDDIFDEVKKLKKFAD